MIGLFIFDLLCECHLLFLCRPSICLCEWFSLPRLAVVAVWLLLRLSGCSSGEGSFLLGCGQWRGGPWRGQGWRRAQLWVCFLSFVSSACAGRSFTSEPPRQPQCWVVVQSLKSCLTLWPHGLQHARLPCPSLSPGIYSDSCPLSWSCHLSISSSVIPSPPALNLSQHQVFLQWGGSLHQEAKVLELQYQSFQCIFRTDFL